MLDKLLEDLKKKLPGAKKANDSEDQEEEVVEETDEDESSESKEKDTKKKSSPLIKIVIILAVGYLAFDFLMPKEDNTDIDQMIQTPVPRKKKPKKDRETEANQAEQVAEVKPEEAKSEETKPQEPAIEEPKLEGAQTTTDDDLSKAISDVPVETKTNDVATDLTQAPVEEINVLKTTDPSGDVGGPSETSPVGLGEGTEVKTSQATEGKSSENKTLESKIVEQNEYVDPPKYEVLGRGLVYNCKGKHWACVDKASYQICHKNMKFNSENGKPSECVTQNVYANEDDCNTVQRYNVSTNVSTSFCK